MSYMCMYIYIYVYVYFFVYIWCSQHFYINTLGPHLRQLLKPSVFWAHTCAQHGRQSARTVAMLALLPTPRTDGDGCSINLWDACKMKGHPTFLPAT